LSIYAFIASSALADGIFNGFYLRTGIDASPSALGVRIINQLGSSFPSSTMSHAESYKFLIMVSPWILTILPWIFTAITIFVAPNRKYGIIIFAGVFVATSLFVGYYNA
jgi:hypothetical protein